VIDCDRLMKRKDLRKEVKKKKEVERETRGGKERHSWLA